MEEVILEDPKWAKLTFVNQKVYYQCLGVSGYMSEVEQFEKKEDIWEGMNRAIAAMEKRREQYRDQDLDDYGYDHYTQDFYYHLEDDSEEEEENDLNI